MAWDSKSKKAREDAQFKERRSTSLNELSDEAKLILASQPPKKPRRPNGKKDREARRLAKLNTPAKPQPLNRFAPSPDNRKTFYASWEWKKLRMQALQRHGHRCQSCGASPQDGVRIVVDHIKPLGKNWGLRLSLENLQVLCDDCNRGKGDWLEADFRPANDEWEEPESDYMTEQYRSMFLSPLIDK